MEQKPERPSEAIERLRQTMAASVIEPSEHYSIDKGDGYLSTYTGEQLIDFVNAFVDFADAEKRSDNIGMLAALDRIHKLD
jgi:hypothetical protein